MLIGAWPTTLKPMAGGYAPAIRSLSGGQSLSGIEQVQPQLHDRWRAEFSWHLRNPSQIAEMRSLITRLRGRSNTITLPAYDASSKPWAVDGYGRTVNFAAVRNKQLDGTSYADGAGLIDTLIAARVTTAALLNSTTLVVQMITGSAPVAGQMFSLGNRLHAIDSLATSGVVHTLQIWPWLRADTPAGSVVNFTSPACEVRLAADDEGTEALRALRLGRFGDVTLRFDEAPAA